MISGVCKGVGDIMELKKLLIVLSIAITITVGIMCCVSYGWYEYSSAQVNVNGSTIKEVPTVIFTSTDNIAVNKIMPILDEDKYNYAEKNIFTVTLGENLMDYDTGIEIFLKDIKISDELKISDYKYELLQDGEIVSYGDFSNIGSLTNMNILPMTILNPVTYPQTYTYELYIWLSENNADQNNLMNKIFSAKLNVNSAIKK